MVHLTLRRANKKPQTEGRVIVDADGYNDSWSSCVGPLHDLNIHDAMKADGYDSKASTPDDHQESQEASDPKSGEGDGSDRLTDEEVMLTVSTVNCFSIERKVWCKFTGSALSNLTMLIICDRLCRDRPSHRN